MSRLMRIRINLNICQACEKCSALKICKLRAIIQPDPGEPPYLDLERCRDCNLCVDACPYNAIEIISRIQE